MQALPYSRHISVSSPWKYHCLYGNRKYHCLYGNRNYHCLYGNQKRIFPRDLDNPSVM